MEKRYLKLASSLNKVADALSELMPSEFEFDLSQILSKSEILSNTLEPDFKETLQEILQGIEVELKRLFNIILEGEDSKVLLPGEITKMVSIVSDSIRPVLRKRFEKPFPPFDIYKNNLLQTDKRGAIETAADRIQKGLKRYLENNLKETKKKDTDVFPKRIPKVPA